MPRPRNSLHWLGDQLGQMGSFRVSEENVATGLQQAEQRDQHRGSCPPPWAPQSRTCIHWCAWGLSAGNLGFSGQTWGKDWALLHRDSLKALECALSCNQKQSRTDQGPGTSQEQAMVSCPSSLGPHGPPARGVHPLSSPPALLSH